MCSQPRELTNEIIDKQVTRKRDLVKIVGRERYPFTDGIRSFSRHPSGEDFDVLAIVTSLNPCTDFQFNLLRLAIVEESQSRKA
ncbi:hypothetical protein DIE04_18975 [Burkholderia sp. Bp8994]|nr:hypothetical protein DIE04_18975 [Burkholderia sp. Bp8994]